MSTSAPLIDSGAAGSNTSLSNSGITTSSTTDLGKRTRKPTEKEFFHSDYHDRYQRGSKAKVGTDGGWASGSSKGGRFGGGDDGGYSMGSLPASAKTSSHGAHVASRASAKDKEVPIAPIVSRYIPPSVVLSPIDKSLKLVLSPDHLECTGCEGGYRMARATHGVHAGSYFWEVQVLEPLGPDAHVRLGWSTRLGELQSFVGYDKYSYGYRDVDGSKCHQCIREDHYGQSYSEGDIIGCFLRLDDFDPRNNEMRFYKNGVDLGPAYVGTEILPAVYMPAISLFMRARVRVNFGPSFILKYNLYGANAVSEVQPMSIEDRREHDQNIARIREVWMAKYSRDNSNSNSSSSSNNNQNNSNSNITNTININHEIS
jgi:hypothetical protein